MGPWNKLSIRFPDIHFFQNARHKTYSIVRNDIGAGRDKRHSQIRRHKIQSNNIDASHEIEMPPESSQSMRILRFNKCVQNEKKTRKKALTHFANAFQSMAVLFES